jgi:hypothetical protein
MIKFTFEDLQNKGALRKQGYIDAMLQNSIRIDDNTFEIDEEVNKKIINEFKITSIVINKYNLEQKAKERGQGYIAEIKNNSKDDGDSYEIDVFILDEIEKKYRNPGMWEMIKNAGNAALEAANSGLDVRNKEETERVLSICADCPSLITDQFRCGMCGCFLSYKVKLKAWHCPQNKW